MRLWQFLLIALAGLCIGAALDEGLHAIRNRSGDEVFQQRLHCRTFADAYVKKNSDANTSLILERVDFSPGRRSCVATISKAANWGRGTTWWSYETVDIVTGEMLFKGDCNGNDAKATSFCGNGQDMELMQKRDKALETALSQR
jgi:hypothetical protein